MNKIYFLHQLYLKIKRWTYVYDLSRLYEDETNILFKLMTFYGSGFKFEINNIYIDNYDNYSIIKMFQGLPAY